MRKSSRRLLWLVAAQMPAPSMRDAYEHFSAVHCQEATAGASEDQIVAMSQEGAGRDALLQTQR